MQQEESRPHGTWHARSVVVVAGPGTGKTWTTKQLLYVLSKSSPGDSYVPFLLPVQKLAYHLRIAAEKAVNYLHLMEWYIKKEYKHSSDLLLDAFHSRRLIIIIDGIDEAADLRTRVEDFIHRVLVPDGHALVVTSRPEGVQEEAQAQGDGSLGPRGSSEPARLSRASRFAPLPFLLLSPRACCVKVHGNGPF